MKDFFEVIKNRRSVKYYDNSVKISREEILEMLDDANSAPSFCNFQPWRYIVVDTPEGKEKLSAANYNKTQNDTSAAMIILLGDLNYFDKFHDIYGTAVDKGYMSPEIKEEFRGNMEYLVNSLDKETKKEIVYYDCGLWSMQFSNVAHARGYDTNILGGFNKKKVVELFDINEDLVPIMLIALGKKERDGRPTTRMSAKDLVSFE
ncbi:nitroreductase family protein [Gemella cuniculi]|uniref:nitroreductase family protein n=1 Tax=Gemella cuniculi TaxID=150240 RepID=UPI0004119585|nr:nitroreductase family protein [Gemella cuniculi]